MVSRTLRGTRKCCEPSTPAPQHLRDNLFRTSATLIQAVQFPLLECLWPSSIYGQEIPCPSYNV